jgi:hypothetical protein
LNPHPFPFRVSLAFLEIPCIKDRIIGTDIMK